MTTMPTWMKKHPCEACGTGYGACAQGASSSWKCCEGCSHPGRWSKRDPYTSADYIEMWQGREMDAHTKRLVRRLAEEERAGGDATSPTP